jgi:hypothetical protein
MVTLKDMAVVSIPMGAKVSPARSLWLRRLKKGVKE